MTWIALLPLLLAPANDVDVLVLAPPAFQTAIETWVEYRQRQGYRVRVIAPAATSFGIQRQIRSAAGPSLRHLLIVGDTHSDAGQGDAAVTATDYRQAEVICRFCPDRDIATDNSYADLDDDGIPELTVGRLPVDSPEQLRAVIQKIIDYEQSEDFGTWRRRINLIAGVGNFGPLIDDAIEKTTRRLVADLLPASFETSVTVASWQSPYCPDPRRLNAVVVDKLNEGCLFWVYIGHGLPHAVAPMRVDRQMFPVFDYRHVSQVHSEHGSPVAIFLACYNGACDASYDCLSEELLLQPRGPVACIAGTRMTMPYGLAIFSYELLGQFSEPSALTLGEMMLAAKRSMVAPESADDEYRQLIDTLGQTMSPTPELLHQELLEHIMMLQLVGDPLLQLARPDPMDLQIEPATGEPRQVIEVTGVAEADGELIVDLCYNRDRLRQRPPRRKEFEMSAEAGRLYDESHRSANDLVCSQKRVRVAAGPFAIQLPVPADASGECHVRSYLKADGRAWSQSAPITLR